jgi:hypothetical protein
MSTSTSPTQGMIGQAMTFNGSNQYIDVPDSSGIGITGDMTIAAWLIRIDVRDQISGLRKEVHDQIGDARVEIGGLRKEMHEGFASINRRLDHIIQMQLDEHAARIKKLETAVFSK